MEFKIRDILTNKWVYEPKLINQNMEVHCSRPQDYVVCQCIGRFDNTKYNELTEFEKKEYSKIEYLESHWMGKPTYNYDIVECYNKTYDKQSIECVEIDLELTHITPFTYRYRIDGIQKHDEPCAWKWETFKIIGNKFDDPDLWEKYHN